MYRKYDYDLNLNRRKRNPLGFHANNLSKSFNKKAPLLNSNSSQLPNAINQTQAVNVPSFSSVISNTSPPEIKNNSSIVNNIKIVTYVQENVILFENKYYKIYHLDENTSIILMKCPTHLTFNEIKHLNPYQLDPKLIYFEGGPINVFIDERDVVLLAFNNQWKKFHSNGFEQYIKFGTPDREVYLNNHIIKARFGGPSIVCKLNGDQENHTIRLDLPAPAVKLSDHPQVDLWYSLVKKYDSTNLNATSLISSSTNKQNTPTNNKQPIKFKKTNHSLDNKDSKSVKEDTNQNKSLSSKQSLNKKKIIVNNSSSIDDEEDILVLEPESLRVKRPYLIEQLYSGLQCTSCSLRFSVGNQADKEKYSKHLDWHFRQNRKSRNRIANNSYNLNRDWYYALDEWIQFKEISLESNDKQGDIQLLNYNNRRKQAAKNGEVKKKELIPIKVNQNDSLNNCSVCLERFKQTWCDEEDEWLLENAIKNGEAYFHPTCLNDDLSTLGKQQSMTDLNNNIDDLLNEESTQINLNDNDIANVNDNNQILIYFNDDLKSNANKLNSIETIENKDQFNSFNLDHNYFRSNCATQLIDGNYNSANLNQTNQTLDNQSNLINFSLSFNCKFNDQFVFINDDQFSDDDFECIYDGFF